MWGTKRRGGDRGAAMIGVVALMAVTAITGVVITTSVLNANGFSSSTRANVQAAAAADAGVDVGFAAISAGNYICTVPILTGGPVYEATVDYFDAAELPLVCSGSTVMGSPRSAVITSVGQSSDRSTVVGNGDQHTVRAVLSITPSADSGELNNAVFSESGFTLTNNSDIIATEDEANDANLYSNGTIICKTQVEVEGTLYSQGNVSLENGCITYSDVWAAGNVTFSSQAIANGDVYAAGTGTLDLSTGHVAGSIISNGSVTMSDNGGKRVCEGTTVSWSVCGSVVSLNGSVTAKQGAAIAGSAYAKNSVTLDNFNGATGVGHDVLSSTGSFINNSNSQAGKVLGTVRVGGTIGGLVSSIGNTAGSCQSTATATFAACGSALVIPSPNPATVLPSNLGYPAVAPAVAVVKAPPRQQMPQINSASSDLSDWVEEGWTVTTFNAATASAAGTTSCEQAKSFVTGSPTGKNLIVVRDCAAPVTWDNSTVTLAGDVAIMSTSGFKTNNVFTVKSNSSTFRAFMTIVPADASFVTWNAVTGTSPTQYSPVCGTRATNVGDININNTTTENVAWLLYSPCLVKFQNQISNYKGQIYGGSVNYPNNSTIQLVKFSIPGLDTSSSSSASSTGGSAVILSRSDATWGE